METLDMVEVVETFRTKFMEGVAGTANRVAGGCADLKHEPRRQRRQMDAITEAIWSTSCDIRLDCIVQASIQ